MRNLLKLRFLWTFLTLFLVLSLIAGGCGKKEKKEEAKSATKQEVAQKASEEKVIKIGAILPLTGSAAEWGENQKQGMELAIEEINRGGGINGKRVIMVVEDDKSDPKTAISAFNKIVMTDQIAVMLTLQSSVSMALAPLANRNKIVLIASAAHPDLVKTGDYIFRCYPTSTYITEILINRAVPYLNIKEIYILYINDDYGVSMKEMFKRLFTKKGGKIVGEDSFEKIQRDFRALITKVLSKRVRALYIPGYGKALGRLLKQLKEMGYSGKILSTQEVSYVDVLSSAKEGAEGVVYVDMPFDPKSKEENARRFVEKFIARYGREPILDASIGYDMTKMLAEVIRKHGYSGDRIKEGLLEVKRFHAVLGDLKMSPSREVMYPLVLKTIKNGKPCLLRVR